MRSATRILISTIGFISGLFGVEHGIGEFLQGNIQPDGLLIQAWPHSSAFAIIGGEPAMTIIPNMRMTGAAAILVSAVVAVWSIAFVHRKFGGPVLILLSILQLLFGGGIAPIVQLVVVGFAALAVHSQYTWLRKTLPANVLRIAEKGWIWVFGITIALCLSLFPGSIILGWLFPQTDPAVIVDLSKIYIPFLLLAVFLSFGHDASAIERGGG
jgi:hypothetical protein